jgi:hypothetical protein
MYSGKYHVFCYVYYVAAIRTYPFIRYAGLMNIHFGPVNVSWAGGGGDMKEVEENTKNKT